VADDFALGALSDDQLHAMSELLAPVRHAAGDY
jgi:hypothetical protein